MKTENVEETPLLISSSRPEDVATNSVSVPPRRFRVAAGVAVMAGTAIVVALTNGALPSRVLEPETLVQASDSVRVSVSNEYSEATGQQPGKGYKFFDYGTVVEPYRPTKLSVYFQEQSSSRSIESASWHVVQTTNIQDGQQIEHHQVDNEVTMTFKHLGQYHVKLEVKDDQGTVMKHETTLNSLYVRRELRSLSVADLEDFMGAMMSVYSMDGKIGKSLYGPQFQNSAYFTSMHLNYAGARDYDHMHDGMGFITQHLALTSEFETALQAVNPAVTVPYWDYTIDKYLVDEGNISNVFESQVFSPTYFGSTNDTDVAPALLTSRWAFLMVPANSSAPTTNAYGYLRAPWNVNQSPYVTRSQTVCGVKEWGSWPSCQTHYDVTFSDAYASWYNYVWEASYTPHGPVHTLIGGYSNCADPLDDMGAAFGLDNVTTAAMKYKVITYLKGAWRSYLIEPPTCTVETPQDECYMQCVSDPDTDSEFLSKAVTYLEGEIGGNWIQSLDTDQQKLLVRTMLCETSYISGDQLEAGSPSDPSFWTIHPTVDRLLQYKHLVNEFDNEDWGNAGGTTKYCTTTGAECLGHHDDDVVPFAMKVLVNGNYSDSYFTNMELYEYSHPDNYRLAYIYDNFAWDHCTATGFDFAQ